MELRDIVRRTLDPAPWSEGDRIPWSEPDFSRRMLREHLSQAHDRASRRSDTIDAHVAWLHAHVLGGRATRVLDLGCGPGLYTSRLAALGHDCVGVDGAPAALEYARAQAAKEGLACDYVEGDLRTAEIGRGFGLALVLSGELNTFRGEDALAILRRVRAALEPGALLALEVHRFASVRATGREPPTWHAAERGLFADEPYLCLRECFWREDAAVATQRYWVIHAATGAVQRMVSVLRAYTDAEYRALLRDGGFAWQASVPSLAGDGRPDPDFVTLLARAEGG